MTDLTRRQVNLGAAWSVPVVLAAVAAPAAQGSQPPPPPVCVDPAGLTFTPAPGMPWKENEGQGFTLVKGDAILVGNDGPFVSITVPVTLWSSDHQVGLLLVGKVGETILESKDGNRATTEIVIPRGETRILQLQTSKKDAEGHLIVGCDRGFILKSAR